jgi:hypothetical protein
MTAYVAQRMVCRQHGLGKIQISQLPYGETVWASPAFAAGVSSVACPSAASGKVGVVMVSG